MKVRVTFKTPDAVGDAVSEAMDRLREQRAEDGDPMDEDEFNDTFYAEQRAVRSFFACGEYVDIEVDTEAMTATVIKP